MRHGRYDPLAAIGVVTLLLAQSCTESPQEPYLGAPLGITTGTMAAEVLLAAGDIATCGTDGDEATAKLLDANPGTVAALGDNTLHGTAADYTQCYDPTWGRHKSTSYTVVGNHEYDPGTADATFDYFGDRAGPRGKGYYSFDLGAWHVIVLNSNGTFVPFSAGSAQDQWLQADLAANTKQCTLAMWHHGRFFSSFTAGFTSSGPVKIFWDRLYAAGADVVLNAQMHHYERFTPMTPDGTVDNTGGIREFNVGTGGESTALPTVIAANSEARGADFGVLKLTLEDGSYSWQFIPIAGASFTDAGHAPCHGASPAPPPTNQPPVAAFTSACSGLGCTFTDGSSDADGTVVAWRWTFGDGATSTDRNPSHTYAAAGTYTVGLTVTDDKGATGSTTKSVTVGAATNQPPKAGFTTSCTNLTCGFTDASTDADGQVVGWRWSFGDGATSTERNPSHAYATGGTYTVGLTVTDDKGATGSTTKSLTVTAPNQPPVANPGGPYRAERQVTFDGSRSFDPDGDTPLSYAWNFGDGSTGTGVRPTHTYAAFGTYTVTLTVTDAKGARSAPAQTTATIANVAPTVHAGSDVTMSPGIFTLRATFSDPGNDGPWRYTVTWGDGLLSASGTLSSQGDAITASHPYLVPGQYHVRVAVTDANGGTGADELVVTVTLPL